MHSCILMSGLFAWWRDADEPAHRAFTYNAGRLASAAAPFVIGSLAASRGFGVAFTVAGAAFLLAAISLYWVPDPRSVELREI